MHANKDAKKEVATSKAHTMDEVYKEFQTPEGERKIYKIEKARAKSTKDFTQIRQIKERLYGNIIKSLNGGKVIMVNG